ncbi:hypothetical protein NUH88_12340 [Nisaea acidiphila]|uniref:Uncharacterized protein n=1 Tax=Nisaea acidiphila TaxID=1862145 RepID=A0A9J7ASB4_9PROT|nr:hypothetical protein [Nisaea acidiphila]UUX48205.1 hypothetical protein NUH88_12340 [Nisaea acidiphila]
MSKTGASESDEENAARKFFGWECSRLRKDFFSFGWLGPIVLALGIAAFAVGLSCPKWQGSMAGSCALLVVIAMAFDYFFFPKPGDGIKAPNPWLRIPSGILASGSAILWILDGWP